MASRTTGPCRIGVDLGGTKVEAAVVDVDGAIVDRRRLPTPRADYAATLETIGRLVADLEGRAGRTMSVGVGMPGTLSPSTGLVMNANSVWLNGRPLGVEAAASTLHRYDARLARSLAGLVKVLDPDVIVLGGGLSAMGHLYQTIPALWMPYVFADHVITPILPPTHGASSGVRGAAWLWDGE